MQLVAKQRKSSQITYSKSDILRQTRAHDYFTHEKKNMKFSVCSRRSMSIEHEIRYRITSGRINLWHSGSKIIGCGNCLTAFDPFSQNIAFMYGCVQTEVNAKKNKYKIMKRKIKNKFQNVKSGKLEEKKITKRFKGCHGSFLLHKHA